MDVAWAAGLFEGEGCISLPKSGGVRVSLAMTDPDIVERFHRIVGFGKTFNRAPSGTGTKKVYGWYVNDRRDIAQFLELIGHLLGQRRTARAIEALERIAAMRDYARQGGDIQHGTLSGSATEKRRGLPVCEACRDAKRAYERERYSRGLSSWHSRRNARVLSV